MKRKILIMGLPGSGKTTLAEKLVAKLSAAWFNADAVRQDIYSELGFSAEDRLSHATRMGKLCDWAKMGVHMLSQISYAQPKKLGKHLMQILQYGWIESKRGDTKTLTKCSKSL